MIAAILVAACTGAEPRPPPRGPTMTRDGYPNVHVKLRLAQRSPATPPRDEELEIWLSGTRFRVRDPSGRRNAEIVADATAPRGLGAPARTMEDMMDRFSAASAARPAGPPTELFGDVATGDGWVVPAHGEPWETSAHKLAPVAEQFLARDKAAGLERVGPATRVGRAGTEYRGIVAGTEDGTTFENLVVRVIAPPYVLLDDARNAGTGNSSYVREIVALDEGSVTDADLAPPRVDPGAADE
ncbi:MAG TPA: hypothetical protein VK601_04515 [Kofleriaceae bacterium]|nr:hypothetical protein [Kofleriaceae bacterium]